MRLFVFLLSFSSFVFSTTTQAASNQEIFEKYCVGEAESAEIPGVNYNNESVKKAAKALSGVEYNAFYFYSGPAMAYGLQKKTYAVYRDLEKNVFAWVEAGSEPSEDLKKRIEAGELELVNSKKTMFYDPRPDIKPASVTDPAHVFLLQLCGEFRDRATMIQAKIKWAQRLIKLPMEQKTAFNPKKDLWPQMKADDYRPFLAVTKNVWLAKKQVQASRISVNDEEDLFWLKDGATIEIGEETADMPVRAMTVCETKYAFAEFGSKKEVPFTSLYAKATLQREMQAYIEGYKRFRDENCSEKDVNYYYDYRGDSNLKHYTPESNGMIWHASSVAAHCSSTTTAKVDSSGKKKLTDEQCEAYFKSPFTSRWLAARAGTAAWLFYNETMEKSFRNDESPVIIFPYDDKGNYIENAPYSFGFALDATPFALTEALSPIWAAIKDAWSKADIGLMKFASFGPDATEKQKYALFNRLRNTVNRHTNWYKSGFVDGRGLKRDQAYSPFVASSYEPSESDSFTAPGYTVHGDADGRKYWLYVFRVPVKNLVTSKSIKDGVKFDLNTAWFDETSLGDTELADQEKAFDRMGTALESEYDAMLYIHNVLQDGGTEHDHDTPLVFSKKP